MTAAARFRQSDVTRAVRGAIAGGMRVARFEIDANGKIVVMAETAARQGKKTSWDDVVSDQT